MIAEYTSIIMHRPGRTQVHSPRSAPEGEYITVRLLPVSPTRNVDVSSTQADPSGDEKLPAIPTVPLLPMTRSGVGFSSRSRTTTRLLRPPSPSVMTMPAVSAEHDDMASNWIGSTPVPASPGVPVERRCG